MKITGVQLIWICLLGLSSGRVYISDSNQGTIPSDITNNFTDQINDNLLFRTLSEGQRDNQRAYKEAGLQTQNKVIDRKEMDSVGKKLLDQYDEAIKEIKEEKHSKLKQTSDIKKERDLTKITGPQERSLYQTYSAPIMMAQPQIIQQPQIAYQQPQIIQQPQVMYQQYSPPPQPTYSQMVPVNNQKLAPAVPPVNQAPTQASEITNSETPKEASSALDDKKDVAKTDHTKPVTAKKDQKGISKKDKKDSRGRKLRWGRRRRKKNRHHHHHRGRGHHHRRRRRPLTAAQKYAKKVKSRRNMTLMSQSLKLKLQKAQISLQSRGKFDRLREKKLKAAAELWTRTFIYDAVLLTEKILYQNHRTSVREKMSNSAKMEAAETKDINKFYNKYYGKSPDEYKAEDLQFHIFE